MKKEYKVVVRLKATGEVVKSVTLPSKYASKKVKNALRAKYIYTYYNVEVE